MGNGGKTAIQKAFAQETVSGYPNQTFRPNQLVSRGEFVVILTREGEATALSFSDQNQIAPWMQQAVSAAEQKGMIAGYEDSFRPDALKSCRNCSDVHPCQSKTTFADDQTIPAWAKPSVFAAAQQGIISGRSNNLFAPNDQATRAETAVRLLKMQEL